MKTFAQDYNFGKQKEEELLTIIKTFFNDDIKQSVKRTEKFDFKGNKDYYELKSRNNDYLKYPTTMIQKSKIFCDDHVFLFNFTDGLYYIKYDKDIFSNFLVKPFQRWGRPDVKDVKQDYIYIPIEKLIKITV
jgi:hypothetical protein